jgi:hypothetical protein
VNYAPWVSIARRLAATAITLANCCAATTTEHREIRRQSLMMAVRCSEYWAVVSQKKENRPFLRRPVIANGEKLFNNFKSTGCLGLTRQRHYT